MNENEFDSCLHGTCIFKNMFLNDTQTIMVIIYCLYLWCTNASLGYLTHVFGLPSYLVHQRTNRVRNWSTLRTCLSVWMRSFYEISKKMSEKLHLIFVDLLSNDQKIKGTSNEDQCRSVHIIFFIMMPQINQILNEISLLNSK